LKSIGRDAEASRDLDEASRIASAPGNKLPDLEARCALVRADASAIDLRWSSSLIEAQRALPLTSGVASLTVPVHAAECRALLEMGRTDAALAQCRAGAENPKAPVVERILVRSVLIDSLARAGKGALARKEADEVMTQAEAMEIHLAAARIAAAIGSLPAQDRPPETSAYRARGLAALEAYVAGAPEDSRAAVRKRNDIKTLERRLRSSS
jgi:hypothetical protein